MKRTWNRAALGVGLAALMALAGCGGGSHTYHRSATSTSAAVVLTPGSVTAPMFGDADPVEWKGHPPQAYPVHGIDVSRYQTSVDWPTARAYGVSFAFIKATEGADHADSGCRSHWYGAAQAGVPRGAYHFYYFCRSAAEQARWFIANVPRERGALPPVLDLEWNAGSRSCPYRPDTESVLSEVQTFLNMVGSYYDQQPIVYTTPDFWENNQLWRLHGAQPWLRSVAAHPSERYPGEAWTFWQYSGTGLVPGIAGQVDLNTFAGSPRDWAAWVADQSL
jgi:lysozyme